MQKLYSRINWENSPSTNTALGESNLNAMDYAIDKIDDRVVSLYGYEERVISSEENAKQSEINAKESEINAKQSEEKAKEYMQNAFDATPSGYEELIQDVADIEEISNEALTIAKGKNRSHVFNTTDDMKTWLSNESNKGLWQVGDNIYIVDVGVPDWWISEVLTEVDYETGYYYRIAQLETQKVDLTNYYTKEDTDELFDNIEGAIDEVSNILSDLIIAEYPSIQSNSIASGSFGSVTLDYTPPTGYKVLTASAYASAGCVASGTVNVNNVLYATIVNNTTVARQPYITWSVLLVKTS